MAEVLGVPLVQGGAVATLLAFVLGGFWLIFTGRLVPRATYQAMLALLEVRNAELVNERDDWKTAAQISAKQTDVIANQVSETVLQLLRAADIPHQETKP